MFNITNKKSIIVHITTGFNFNHNILSNVLFSSLGSSGKYQSTSQFFSIIDLSIICTIGLININEK